LYGDVNREYNWTVSSKNSKQ